MRGVAATFQEWERLTLREKRGERREPRLAGSLGLGLCAVCSSWGVEGKCDVIYNDICEALPDSYIS